MKKDLQTYYTLKPFIPRPLQIWFRRKFIRRRLKDPETHQGWPILEKAGQAPENWAGWPGDSKFALVLTHDVEHEKGLHLCKKLAEIELSLGFCSSYNFVPERYKLLDEIRTWLTTNGFEVGVHGLNT